MANSEVSSVVASDKRRRTIVNLKQVSETPLRNVLESFDKDGDGKIDLSELQRIIYWYGMWKYASIGLCLIILTFVWSTFGLTVWAINLTKEFSIDNGLLTADEEVIKMSIASVEIPLKYASLMDKHHLDSLDSVSLHVDTFFGNSSDGMYHMRIAGYSHKNVTHLTLYGADGSKIWITMGNIIFKHVDFFQAVKVCGAASCNTLAVDMVETGYLNILKERAEAYHDENFVVGNVVDGISISGADGLSNQCSAYQLTPLCHRDHAETDTSPEGGVANLACRYCRRASDADFEFISSTSCSDRACTSCTKCDNIASGKLWKTWHITDCTDSNTGQNYCKKDDVGSVIGNNVTDLLSCYTEKDTIVRDTVLGCRNDDSSAGNWCEYCYKWRDSGLNSNNFLKRGVNETNCLNHEYACVRCTNSANTNNCDGVSESSGVESKSSGTAPWKTRHLRACTGDMCLKVSNGFSDLKWCFDKTKRIDSQTTYASTIIPGTSSSTSITCSTCWKMEHGADDARSALMPCSSGYDWACKSCSGATSSDTLSGAGVVSCTGGTNCDNKSELFGTSGGSPIVIGYCLTTGVTIAPTSAPVSR